MKHTAIIGTGGKITLPQSKQNEVSILINGDKPLKKKSHFALTITLTPEEMKAHQLKVGDQVEIILPQARI